VATFEVPAEDVDWLSAVPAAQASVVREMLSAGQTEEQVAELWLNQAGAATNFGFGTGGALSSYFANVRAEFVGFVCGDEKYAKEREEALALWRKGGQVTLVAGVAGIIATTLGLAATALVPVVALLFSIVAKLGVNAFCATCAPSAPDKS
jgi:hypothetical protein